MQYRLTVATITPDIVEHFLIRSPFLATRLAACDCGLSAVCCVKLSTGAMWRKWQRT